MSDARLPVCILQLYFPFLPSQGFDLLRDVIEGLLSLSFLQKLHLQILQQLVDPSDLLTVVRFERLAYVGLQLRKNQFPVT